MEVAREHDFQEGAVEHLHFLGEFAVRGVEQHAAQEPSMAASEAMWAGGVRSKVRLVNGTPPAPTRSRVQIEDELLHGPLTSS